MYVNNPSFHKVVCHKATFNLTISRAQYFSKPISLVSEQSNGRKQPILTPKRLLCYYSSRSNTMPIIVWNTENNSSCCYDYLFLLLKMACHPPSSRKCWGSGSLWPSRKTWQPGLLELSSLQCKHHQKNWVALQN